MSWGQSPALAAAFGFAVYIFTKSVILRPGGETALYYRGEYVMPCLTRRYVLPYQSSERY